MKGSYFGFGSPQQQADITCKVKKRLSFSYNMHLFLPYCSTTPKDSFNDSFFQTPPLRDANLQWLVDFIKAGFVSF